MNDQGLEKIPFEFRAYCWEKATEAKADSWRVFKEAVMQIRFGGVSSEAEAKRLFWAEQISHKLFLDNSLTPSQMAFNLSEDIQNSFQHASRPVSEEVDAEKQTMEILNYYFSTEESLANFELALNGTFDEQLTQEENIFAKPEKAFFEEDFVFESEIPHSEPTVNLVQVSSEIKEEKVNENKNNFDLNQERPKVRIYLEFKENKYDLTTLNELSEKIQKVIDEHFFQI